MRVNPIRYNDTPQGKTIPTQALLISEPSMFGRRQLRSGLPRLRTATFAMAVAFASWPAFAQTGPGWTTAWGTSQQVLGQTRVSNATLRLIARVTVSGDAIRLRFDNKFGTAPVTFGKVST